MNQTLIVIFGGVFLYALCKFVITIKRRIQANRDRERLRLSMRPNESELKASQNWHAMEALKRYTKPKKEIKNGL